jgi:2-oxoglutarate dehydrogenase E2 component (dihydrolipoamide succinyltransferase)
MKINVVMPQLGESVSEGEVIRWVKRAGESVRRDEALVEVKTDKATVEIPAPSSGTLTEIVVQEGETVKIGADIARIESTSEAAVLAVEGAPPAPRKIEPTVTRQEKKPARAPLEVKPAIKPQPAKTSETLAAKPATPPAVRPAPQPPPSKAPRPPMTPLARRIASEFGLDPSTIQGTGEGGRITREDVLNVLKAQERTAPGAGAAGEGPEQPAAPKVEEGPVEKPATSPAARPADPARSAVGEDELVPLSPIRRRIAARLVQSSQSIPRVTTAIEADVTALTELRKQHRESYEKAGIKLTYMPFIMKATVAALKASPAVNASWGGEKLILHRRVHLGIAVSVEGGLIVPVIRNADDLSVRQLAQRLAEVAEHARAGKLTAGETEGGTFTITNPGLFGTVFSTPIINPPEAAILAVCRIAELPVAREGKIVIRHMMNLCLSYDHRIIDGETAIRFLQQIRATLEAAKFDMG